MASDKGTMASPQGETEVNYIANETRIVMIGKTGSGKSSTANTLLGMNWFQSMLSSVSITRKTSSKVMKYKGRYFLLIDTPGLFDTEIPNKVMKREIMKCVALAAPGLHAVLLVTKIGRFTEEEKQNIIELKKYFGEGLGRYLIIIFTGKDDLDADGTKLEKYLEGADKVLKQVVEECEHRCIAVNNKASEAEKEKFKDDLLALIDRTVKLNGGCCYTNDMFEEAERHMKLAEMKKLMELVGTKRAEREEEVRGMNEEHELKMAEYRKKAGEKLEKEKAAMEEKLCVEKKKSEKEAEGRANKREQKEDELKQKEENKRYKNLQREREKAIRKLLIENEKEVAKLRREGEKEMEEFEKEKAELLSKLHIDQMKFEEKQQRILQKLIEERTRNPYEESLQREARSQVRKDIEEDKSLLDRFIHTVSKPFRWLKQALTD